MSERDEYRKVWGFHPALTRIGVNAKGQAVVDSDACKTRVSGTTLSAEFERYEAERLDQQTMPEKS